MAGTKRVIQTLEASWRENAVIDSRYRLNSLIGRGGFGEVWRAHPVTEPQRTVAIKRLLQAVASEQARRRLQCEKRALKLLYRHENVVRVYDSGKYLGQDYLVLEHVAGGTLRSWLEWYRQGPTPRLPSLRAALDLLSQICNGLQAAHSLSIVHRDLKPDNIMLLPIEAQQWQVKVVDFGVARIGRRADTLTGDRLGTHGYMSPEQTACGWNDVGPASDVFAIGVLCVELLTLDANSPKGDPYANFVVQHWDKLPRYLRARRRDVPIALWSAIERSLHPRAKERYANAGALGLAIKQTLSLADPAS